MRRPSASDSVADRKLIDRVATGIERWGRIEALFAITYELDPEFLEVDLLPSVLGLGAWDDRSWASRIALERALASMEAAAVVMQADRYRGRPRPLRVELTPFAVREQRLHAKLVLTVHERAVRLLVGSSNLTTPGYRHNREVALAIDADADSPTEVALVREALDSMPTSLRERLAEGARLALELARRRLAEWPGRSAGEGDRFVWGGGERAIVDQIVEAWAGTHPIERITIVSPFWSDAAGPETIRELVRRLRPKSLLDRGGSLEVRLLTEASCAPDGSWRPQAPDSFLGLDPGHPNVRVTIQGVSPAVKPDEVAGRDGFRGTRPLHAKVAVLEGADTTVAYLGSANFTRRGWGLGTAPSKANVEAGVLLRRQGREGAALAALVPETIGPVVDLASARGGDVARPDATAPETPWPYFLREVLLQPVEGRPGELELVVIADADAAPFEVSTREDEPSLLLWAAGGVERYRMTPDVRTFRILLLTREVRIAGGGLLEPAVVPLNVTLEARMALPIAPDERRPDELLLVSYYQGRLAWEELFEDPEAPLERARLASAASFVGSSVDTSRIQSYQIRAFVQALGGIGEDLRTSAVTGASIRLAMRGPVSPVALAQQVAETVRRRERSCTAAAFQLAEILAQLDGVRGFAVSERLGAVWADELEGASRTVRSLLDELRVGHPEALGPGTSFGRYAGALARNVAQGSLS